MKNNKKNKSGKVNLNGTILITGGSGYIGSHTIIEMLENTSFDVVSIDNQSNSSTKTYKRIEKITGRKVVNYSIDLCDKEKTEKVFKKHKFVGIIHFAAFKMVGESVEQPLKYYRNNILSLINILELANKYGVPNFIFSSSCSVYGNVAKLPVNESTPIGNAESPYAHTKQIGEKIISDFCAVNKNINAIALRYFNPVGAHLSGLNGEDPINKPNNLVPIITATAAGKLPKLTIHGNDYPTRDGTCIRDYIHVSDIGDAHILALEFLLNKKNKQNYCVYNLGSGNGVSVLEIIKAFEKVAGMKLNYGFGERRAGDVVSIYSDSAKALKDFGWKPKLIIEEMMTSAWKWEQNKNKS